MVVPQRHAGGAPQMAYEYFDDPVMVELFKRCRHRYWRYFHWYVHMKHVAVPVRLCVKEIGKAHVTACRVRPKSIGGERAVYNEVH
ncbi:MAG: DUF436 family protein [Veillonella parvula]